VRGLMISVSFSHNIFLVRSVLRICIYIIYCK